MIELFCIYRFSKNAVNALEEKFERLFYQTV